MVLYNRFPNPGPERFIFAMWSLDQPEGKTESKTSTTCIIFNSLILSLLSAFRPGIDLSKLPQDLVVEILKRLPLSQVIRAKVICSSWKSAADNALSFGTHKRLLEAPRVFLTHERLGTPNNKNFCLFTELWKPQPYLVNQTIHHLLYRFSLITLSLGWMIFWDDNVSSFLIFNPFTEFSVQISAPDSVSTGDQVLKFVLTKRKPISSLRIYFFCYIKERCYKLLYFDKKNFSWVKLEVGVEYQDILWNKKQLYALRTDDFIIKTWNFNVENSTCSNKRTIRIYDVPFVAPYTNCYLIASDKEILLVNTKKKLRQACKLNQEAYILDLERGLLKKFGNGGDRRLEYNGLLVVVHERGVFLYCDALIGHVSGDFQLSLGLAVARL